MGDIKTATADLMDLLLDAQEANTAERDRVALYAVEHPEDAPPEFPRFDPRLMALAITSYEQAVEWAVKSVTAA